MEHWRAAGSMWAVPYYLALKAEALHLAERTPEALEAISEAEALVEKSEERWWCAELHRLRGVFLTAIGADESQREVSFCAAIRIANEQKSISLAKRAKATYAKSKLAAERTLICSDWHGPRVAKASVSAVCLSCSNCRSAMVMATSV